MMDEYTEDYSSSSEDEEWDERCEEAVMEQDYDTESRIITDRLHELNVGYNPLKGFADAKTQASWMKGDVRLGDVIDGGKLKHSKFTRQEYICAERIENFLEAARCMVHHHRRRVPGTTSVKYTCCVAAAMIKWQYNL